MYKTRLDELLNKIDLLRYSDINCMHHTDMISVLYNDINSACIAASDHIPTTTIGGPKKLNLDGTKM